MADWPRLGFDPFWTVIKANIKDLFERITGTLPKEEQVKALNDASSVIGQYIGAVTTVGMQGDLIAEIIDKFQSTFGPPAKKLSKAILDTLQKAGWINPSIRKNLESVAASATDNSPFLILLIPIAFIMQYITITLQASAGTTVAEINKSIRPNLPSGSDVIRAAFIDPSTNVNVRDIFAKNGMPEDVIDLIYKANYALYDVTTIRDLYFRGEININRVYERLREHGFTDTRIDEMMKSWKLIPPVQDLITMAVREVFSPSQRAELGLDADFPNDFKIWSEKQGLKSPWPENYWAMHWKLPSAEQGFEMFHRGKITEAQLKGLIKALDYSPIWHDRLLAISYNIPTRVDVRRMRDLGMIDKKDVNDYHLQMGYDPVTAQRLTDWVEIEYNDETRKLTESTIINEYLDGFMGRGECETLLKSLGYTDQRIDMMINVASYKRAYAKQSDRIEAFHKLYLSGQYVEQEIRAELGEFNIDDRRLDELIDLWRLQKKAGLKLPSKGELDTLLFDGDIDITKYRIEMHRGGYTDNDIDLFIKSIQAKIRKASAETSDEGSKHKVTAVKLPSKADYDGWVNAGIINTDQYRSGLSELGYREIDIKRYVAEINTGKGG